MSIVSFRFKAHEDKVILQVLEQKSSPYDHREDWRDGKVEDLLDVAKLMRPQVCGHRCNYQEELK